MQLSEYITEQYVGQDKARVNLLDDIYKAAKDGYKEKLGYVPMKPMALITVHDPESSIIESVGFSEPDDILTDNFGVFLSLLQSGAPNSTKSMVDYLGVSHFSRVNSNSGSGFQRREDSPFVASVGSYFKIGRNFGGAGSVARSDFDLNEPYLVAPESNFFTNTPGGWLSGNQQVVINGLLASVTTSDSIGECGLYLYGTPQAASNRNKIFLMSHDIAGASFSGGQNVNVTYTWSIT